MDKVETLFKLGARTCRGFEIEYSDEENLILSAWIEEGGAVFDGPLRDRSGQVVVDLRRNRPIVFDEAEDSYPYARYATANGWHLQYYAEQLITVHIDETQREASGRRLITVEANFYDHDGSLIAGAHDGDFVVSKEQQVRFLELR